MALRPSCDLVASRLRQPTRLDKYVGMSNVTSQENSASSLYCNMLNTYIYIAYHTSSFHTHRKIS